MLTPLIGKKIRANKKFNAHHLDIAYKTFGHYRALGLLSCRSIDRIPCQTESSFGLEDCL